MTSNLASATGGMLCYLHMHVKRMVKTSLPLPLLVRRAGGEEPSI